MRQEAAANWQFQMPAARRASSEPARNLLWEQLLLQQEDADLLANAHHDLKCEVGRLTRELEDLRRQLSVAQAEAAQDRLDLELRLASLESR